MSKANPYDSFPNQKLAYIRMDPIGVTAGRTGSRAHILDGEFDPGSG